MKLRTKPWYKEVKRQIRMDPRFDDYHGKHWSGAKLGKVYDVDACLVIRMRLDAVSQD